MITTTIEQRRKTLRETIERAGGITAFRKAMGLTHQGVYYWIKAGHVPVEPAMRMEELFGTPRLAVVDPRIAKAISTPAPTDLV